MGKFNKSGGRSMPELNTSSLPDMIFAVLFFFMVTTTMRDMEPKVNFKPLPVASEAISLERKSLVSTIYIGTPNSNSGLNVTTGTYMELNGRLSEVSAIQDYIAGEKNSLSEADQPFMTISLKANSATHMRYISDVKEALRKAHALKISYSAIRSEN